MTPAEIARSLSAAQRRYMTQEMRSIGNPAVWVLCGEGAISRAAERTFTALTKRDLLYDSRFGPTSLTETGLAVRKILEEQEG